MAATEATPRTYYGGSRYLQFGVNGTSTIYGGSFVALDSDGYAVPLTTAVTVFAGIAEADADNSDGADGAISVRVYADAVVELDVTSVAGPDDVGSTVYAGADDQVDLADAGSDIAIGKVVQHISGTTCLVHIQAAAMRSL
jgi:hypothetical protein